MPYSRQRVLKVPTDFKVINKARRFYERLLASFPSESPEATARASPMAFIRRVQGVRKASNT